MVASKKWCMRIGSLIILVLLVSLVEADERGEQQIKNILNKRLAPFEKEGDAAVESSISEEINFLTTVFLRGGVDANPYYAGLLTRWNECATKESLPSMERFIKRSANYKRAKRGQLPWSVFATLDEGIQNLWFRVKTEEMSPEKKTEIALYGFLGDGAPVPVDRDLAEKWIVEIGKPARKAFYQFLERKAAGKQGDLLVGALYGVLVGQYVINDFKPTNEEIGEFLGVPGTWGHIVILAYLVEWDKTEKAIGPLLTMVQSDQYDLKGLALNMLKRKNKFRDQIIPVIVAEAEKERLVPKGNSRWKVDIPDELRQAAFYVLRTMGKDLRTVALLTSYVKKNKDPETWLDLSQEGLGARKRATKEAVEILKEWGEWPVK